MPARHITSICNGLCFCVVYRSSTTFARKFIDPLIVDFPMRNKSCTHKIKSEGQPRTIFSTT